MPTRRHLQGLLRAAYCEIYSAKPEDVEFLLVPMPRLEIETIQDFKVLHEIGALSPDMTVKLSRILLGEEPGAKRERERNGDPDKPQKSSAGVNTAVEPFPERQQVVGAKTGGKASPAGDQAEAKPQRKP